MVKPSLSVRRDPGSWRDRKRSVRTFFLLLLPLLFACAETREEVVLDGATMGTRYAIKYIPEKGVDRQDIAVQSARLLRFLDATFSTYQEDSELSRLNKADVGREIAVSPLMWQLLLIAQAAFEATGGAFDPTVGALVELWGFGPVDTHDRIPSVTEVAARHHFVGYQKLEFLPSSRAVRKRAAIQIDLSAIAKGFAAEQVGALLVEKGIEDFMVEVGGEIQAAGVNAKGQRWRIAIEAPVLARGQVRKIISLVNQGVATSGDYRNYFEHDGVRYSHTIDPGSGQPIKHKLASVSVLHPSAALADALATAYMVLGPDQALAMANRDKVAAYFLVRSGADFVEHSSEAFVQQISD